MKKNILLLGLVIAAMGLLVFCTKENPIATPSNGNDTVLVSTTVLFKASGVQAVPDSVASIRLTVTYGSVSIVDTFDYHAHTGTVRAIPAHTAFTLKVEGLDGAGGVIFSGTKSFTGLSENMSVEITANEVSPRAPSDLILEALSSSSIKLTWHDNSSNEQGFIIERSPGNDSHFVAIDTAIADLDSLVDSVGLLPLTFYYYRLRSLNGAGLSSYLTAQSIATFSASDPALPVITFTGYSAGDMFNTTPITFNVTVTDIGSGLDTVYIEGVAA
ncbi:MAG: fibronectin type III domain-containing protein, partial [Fibrobacterota bacterium]